jgi:DNA replication ATP-dependent helicase Dna2
MPVDYFCILGPPVPKKTRVVLKGIVNNLHRSTDENIMLLACTNRAVDEICLALQKSDLPYIRLGKSSDDSIESLDTLKNRINNEEDLKNVYDRIINQRVFVSTVSTAQQNRIFNLKKFTTVIVDEASQLLEPDIVGLLTKFKRFILIGDEKQLPPVVTQDENLTKVGNPDLEKICLYDLSMSLFERLILNAKNNKWHKAYRTLKNQKRMHNDIAEFPNKHFYEGALATVKDDSAPYIVTFSKNSYNKHEKILANIDMVFIESKMNQIQKKKIHVKRL